MSLPFLMPERLTPGPAFVWPLIETCFLVAMVVSDPGRINRRSVTAHRIRLGLVVVLVTGAAWGTLNLTHVLIQGHNSITAEPSSLLAAGGLVWLAQIISFAFLYWELDLGGPGQRANVERRYPNLAFPQDLNAEVASPGWRPVFLDYLYVALTNGIAFSPTDTMPTAHWAKLAMGIQSVTSLLIIGLVIARAVNILQ